LEISVVLPVYIKTKEHLAMSVKCLELARKHTKLPYELVIVETCSDYLKDYADVHIYEKERTDVNKSCNRSFKCASGQYIVGLTNDVFVSENWLECLKECFQKEDCGIATLASTESGNKKENKIIEEIYFPITMIPRWLFDKIGYLDEDYKMYWADADFMVRNYEAGYKMYRNYNSVVSHSPGSTLYDEKKWKEACNFGRTLFNEKHKDCDLPIFHKLR